VNGTTNDEEKIEVELVGDTPGTDLEPIPDILNNEIEKNS
jgi:hypothetical protein